MSRTVELGAGGLEPSRKSAIHTVRLGSRVLEWLFTALLSVFACLVVAMVLAMLFYAGPHLQVTGHSFELTTRNQPMAGAVVFGTLPLGSRVAYALVAIAHSAPALMIFFSLRSLFGLYARGVVFAPQTSARLKQVGLWLTLAAFTPLACHLFLAGLGVEVDHAWFHAYEVQELVLGALVFVIAAVMQVGREIEEDRSQFV